MPDHENDEELFEKLVTALAEINGHKLYHHDFDVNSGLQTFRCRNCWGWYYGLEEARLTSCAEQQQMDEESYYTPSWSEDPFEPDPTEEHGGKH